MANILTLQHWDAGHPGRFGTTLRDHGFRLDLRRPDKGEQLPKDLDNVHGLLILGGPQNVDEGHSWMREEQDLIRAAHQAEMPVVGICLGCQLVAQALGGEVGPMDKPEQGFTKVSLTLAGQTDTAFAGIPWDSLQAQSHGYEVKKLPDGATLLAYGPHCRVQAFRAGLRTFAFQYHPEADAPMLAAMAHDDAFNARAGVTREELLRQADEHYARFAVISDRLATNLVLYAFPAAGLLAV